MSTRRRSEAGGATVAGDREQIRRSFLGLALCRELKQTLQSLNLTLELLAKRIEKQVGRLDADVSGPMAALGRVCDRINDCLDSFASRSMPDVISDDLVELRPILEEAIERVRDRAKK